MGDTYKDDLEQHLLIHLHELLVPLIDVRRLLARLVVILVSLSRVVAVVLAPLDHLAEHSFVHLRIIC